MRRLLPCAAVCVVEERVYGGCTYTALHCTPASWRRTPRRCGCWGCAAWPSPRSAQRGTGSSHARTSWGRASPAQQQGPQGGWLGWPSAGTGPASLSCPSTHPLPREPYRPRSSATNLQVQLSLRQASALAGWRPPCEWVHAAGRTLRQNCSNSARVSSEAAWSSWGIKTSKGLGGRAASALARWPPYTQVMSWPSARLGMTAWRAAQVMFLVLLACKELAGSGAN